MEAHDETEKARSGLLGRQYDKIVFCGRLLLWSHVALALIIAFTFLSTRDYSHFAWWHRGSGSFQLVRALIPMSPYLVSGILASDFDTAAPARIYAFCVILALGTGVIGWTYVSHWVEAFSSWLDVPFYVALLMFCMVQAMAFALAADLLLDVENFTIE
jgi:hypothetical protein